MAVLYPEIYSSQLSQSLTYEKYASIPNRLISNRAYDVSYKRLM